eukprot:g57209.t1
MVSSVNVKHAAHLSWTDNYTDSTGPAILVTQFQYQQFSYVVGVGKDQLSVLANASILAAGGKYDGFATLCDSVVWPNEFKAVPPGVLSDGAAFARAAVVAGGFIPPEKHTGLFSHVGLHAGMVEFNIRLKAIRNWKGLSRRLLSSYNHMLFYGRDNSVRYLWCSGHPDHTQNRFFLPHDGVVGRGPRWTGRPRHGTTNDPMTGQGVGQLVWLKQPKRFTLPWQEQCADDDGIQEVLAAQFFQQPSLVLYWCEERSWAECGAAGTVQHRAIDQSLGPVFDVSVADLNADGCNDLLVTSNKNDGSGAVVAYEIPSTHPKTTGTWVKHVLVTGFKPLHPHRMGAGGPGNAAIAYNMWGASLLASPTC